MDLNEIMIFIKVVQSGSFSEAARQLGLPKSTVSHKFSSLEKRLGVTLIQRTTRKLNITPAGEAYFKRCLQGVEEIKAAETEVVSSLKEPQGILRVTAPLDLASSILPAAISRFMRKYRKVKVEMILTDRRVDLLTENVDVAIRAGDLKDSTLIAKKIGNTQFIAVATPKYLKEKGVPVNPGDLVTHQCLLFPSLGTSSWSMTNGKQLVNVPVTGHAVINHLEMIKMMCILDDGVALLPHLFVINELKSGKLVRLLPGWRSSVSPVHFVYPAQRFVSPKLSAFIEFIGKELKDKFENVGEV